MKRNMAHALCANVAIALLLPGCASIVSGRHADVVIDSYPSNAHVVIRDGDGRAVTSLNTPGTVSLKRNRRFFMPARYTAIIDAPGYETVHVPIRSTVNPWVLGNVVIGGVPGLIVDNATGAAWKPKQSEIHRELVPSDGVGAEQMYSADQPSSSTPVDPAQYSDDQPDLRSANVRASNQTRCDLHPLRDVDSSLSNSSQTLLLATALSPRIPFNATFLSRISAFFC